MWKIFPRQIRIYFRSTGNHITTPCYQQYSHSLFTQRRPRSPSSTEEVFFEWTENSNDRLEKCTECDTFFPTLALKRELWEYLFNTTVSTTNGLLFTKCCNWSLSLVIIFINKTELWKYICTTTSPDQDFPCKINANILCHCHKVKCQVKISTCSVKRKGLNHHEKSMYWGSPTKMS